MKITTIKIQNFRILNDFSLDLENDLSLVIGKNNTGKTSILTALDRFLNSSDKRKLSIDDFNLSLKSKLLAIISDKEKLHKDDYSPLGISLKLYLEYDEKDDLSEIRPIIMSLNPDDNNIVLSFEYMIEFVQILAMKRAYLEESEKYNNEPETFLKEHYSSYFTPISRKSISVHDEKIFTDLDQEKISLKNILSFQFVSAKRDVTNKENNNTLSGQSSRIYNKTADNQEKDEIVDNFKSKLRATDIELSGIYEKLFQPLLEKVSKYGGIKKSETTIKIASTLQHRELLNSNTTVLYSHNEHQLPEHHYGLGYMNLISMIFEIEIIMANFRRNTNEKPAAINLFFIEEPEAHTHPQMQYVFINNIKSLLKESRVRDDKLKIQLQTIISTHSSHIVCESEFNDIKYLKKNSSLDSIQAKNLKQLEKQFSSNTEEQKQFRFLKQYLTLNRAELFFADKAILIEGDTERVLLPAMMKKLDQEIVDDSSIPLLSQNISIVEVGAHSQTFEKFIDFIGVKTLIITDIDSCLDEIVMDNGKAKKNQKGGDVRKLSPCLPDNFKATKTTNSSLRYFHNKKIDDLKYFRELEFPNKILKKIDNKWTISDEGTILVVYQTPELGYHARSFEDSFFHINKAMLGTDSSAFPSLTKIHFDTYVQNKDASPYEFAKDAVNSKPSLAIEVLLNSTNTETDSFTNWLVPAYIKEGLEWLMKD